MDDKQFWLTVRAALIMIVRAIEKRYDLKASELHLSPTDSVAHAADYQHQS